ncbi:REP-associated tyrosine transposase [Halomonas sp. NPDC076908]|uniref:REP-associated tyrosine transposase n=1 Tax=Halomonas sp. NPDC076908 TaxID=3390567 RepID=UPI003CFC3C37
MQKGHALRRGRYSVEGGHYLITIATQKRYPYFLTFEHACSASRNFYHPRVTKAANTLSFVVMPDHIHWLLQLNGELSEAIRRYKSYVSLAIGERIWQDGFHDRMIRQEEDLKSVARYIVGNPLRAGLATNINQYSFWNAAWL